MAVAIYLPILILLGTVLLIRGGRLARKGNFVSLYGELYIPVFLYLIYGLGGFALLFASDSARFSYVGVNFTNWDILLGFLVMSVAIITVLLAFRTTYGTFGNRRPYEPRRGTEQTITLLVFSFLAFDFIARAVLIYEGAYFSWLRTGLIIRGDLASGGSLGQMQSSIEPFLAALLIYKSVRSRKWVIVMGIFLFLVLLKGQRSALFEVVLGSFFSYMFFARGAVNYTSLIKYVFILLAFAYISSSVIIEVRAQYRTSMSTALDSPAKFVGEVAFEHIPAAVFGRTNNGGQLKGSNLMARLTAWSGSFSSEINRLRTGWDFMPATDMIKALTLPIPSVIYPGKKPIITQGSRTAEWFNLGVNNPSIQFDPGTTIFSDINKFGGVLLVFLLSVIYGVVAGGFAGFTIERYSYLGILVFFGSIGLLTVRANSYAAFFVGVRNVIIIIAIVEIVSLVRRFRISGFG